MSSIVSITPEKIHHAIAEQISRGVPYIDALVHYAETNNLEIEAIADVIKKSSILKEKVRSEAIDLRMVKRNENDGKDITSICE